MDVLQMMGETQARLKYGRYLPGESRREMFDEIVNRYDHFFLSQNKSIPRWVMNLVHERKVLPSMRLMQFAGTAAEQENARAYNCSFLHIDSINAFAELMYLSLCGTGVGFSVYPELIRELPRKKASSGYSYKVHVADTKEGWAESIRKVIHFAMEGLQVEVGYGKIRPKGSPLVTSGGKAPGPQPLMRTHDAILKIIDKLETGSRLRTIDCYDIACHCAAAVLAGGIRRSAMICLFDPGDSDMLAAKTGNWWEDNIQRSYSNNSAVLDRRTTTMSEFMDLAAYARDYGEPGVYWTNNRYWGTNPCVEIGLRDRQFCNLTEIRASDIDTQDELLLRTKAATILGTYQASLTDFNIDSPLSSKWKFNSEDEALLGVSMTGIASRSFINGLKDGAINLYQAADFAKYVNEDTARHLGINPAARVTAIKPSGTTSIVMGTSSGIHAWHSPYYIRRVTVRKEDPLYGYMKTVNPHMIEDSVRNDEEAYLKFPIQTPKGSLIRTDESAEKLINRATRFYSEWVLPGHRSGDNTHNISCTVSVKPGEWDHVYKKMWDLRKKYNGLSVLSFDPNSYPQTPFEEIDKQTYLEMVEDVSPINLSDLKEEEDNTDLQGELACAGPNGCEI